MRKLALAFALLAALAYPAGAAAKELQKVEVCGPEDCAAITDQNQLSTFFTAGDSSSGPPPAGPYYELRFTVDAETETVGWSAWYVPAAQRLASVDDRQGVLWSTFDADALSAATKEVKPFPAPEITSVTIGTRTIEDDPSSYLRLFGVESAGEAVPQGLADWQPVVFHSKAKTPWTLEQTSLYYSPSNKLLQRGTEMVKLPGGLAADVDAGRSLDAGSSFPWTAVLAALLLLALLLLGMWMVPRVRGRATIRRAPSTA